MTDQLRGAAAGPELPPRPVELRGAGRDRRRLWARLLYGGRYLEIADRGQVVVFDLQASAALGRAVVWYEDMGD